MNYHILKHHILELPRYWGMETVAVLHAPPSDGGDDDDDDCEIVSYSITQ